MPWRTRGKLQKPSKLFKRTLSYWGCDSLDTTFGSTFLGDLGPIALNGKIPTPEARKEVKEVSKSLRCPIPRSSLLESLSKHDVANLLSLTGSRGVVGGEW